MNEVIKKINVDGVEYDIQGKVSHGDTLKVDEETQALNVAVSTDMYEHNFLQQEPDGPLMLNLKVSNHFDEETFAKEGELRLSTSVREVCVDNQYFVPLIHNDRSLGIIVGSGIHNDGYGNLILDIDDSSPFAFDRLDRLTLNFDRSSLRVEGGNLRVSSNMNDVLRLSTGLYITTKGELAINVYGVDNYVLDTPLTISTQTGTIQISTGPKTSSQMVINQVGGLTVAKGLGEYSDSWSYLGVNCNDTVFEIDSSTERLSLRVGTGMYIGEEDGEKAVMLNLGKSLESTSFGLEVKVSENRGLYVGDNGLEFRPADGGDVYMNEDGQLMLSADFMNTIFNMINQDNGNNV